MTGRQTNSWGASAACLLALLASATRLWAEPPLSLEEALVLAQAANRTIAAAQARRAIDEAAVATARERPNPELKFEDSRETPHQSWTASQLLEIGGKRHRRIELARASSRVGDAEIDLIVAQTRADVRRAYYALAAAQRKIAIGHEARESAEKARAAAHDRFEAGDVARLDLLESEIAALEADNEASALSGELATARSELNVLIGRDPEAGTAVAEEIETAEPPEAEAALDAALAGNAALRQLDLQIEEAQARVALARAQRVPDPTLEAALTHDSPPEFTYGWRAAVALSIPLFTRHQAAVRGEEAALARLRLERQAMAVRLQSALVGALARARAQRQAYLRFRDEILPRTREADAMAEDSYRSGHTSLVALLQSLQTTRDIRSKAVDAAFQFQSALADLELATKVGLK